MNNVFHCGMRLFLELQLLIVSFITVETCRYNKQFGELYDKKRRYPEKK